MTRDQCWNYYCIWNRYPCGQPKTRLTRAEQGRYDRGLWPYQCGDEVNGPARQPVYDGDSPYDMRSGSGGHGILACDQRFGFGMTPPPSSSEIESEILRRFREGVAEANGQPLGVFNAGNVGYIDLGNGNDRTSVTSWQFTLSDAPTEDEIKPSAIGMKSLRRHMLTAFRKSRNQIR